MPLRTVVSSVAILVDACGLQPMAIHPRQSCFPIHVIVVRGRGPLTLAMLAFLLLEKDTPQ